MSDENLADGLTKEQVWDKRDNAIRNGFIQSEPVLIDALPGTGKSYGIIKWADESGEPVTVLTERHDLYDQYEEWAEDTFDLDAQQLPTFHNKCPTAQEDDNVISEGSGYTLRRLSEDDEDEPWHEKVRTKYRKGLSGRELHYNSTRYFGEKLPCQRDGSCPYMEALGADFSDKDVLIGNFRQVFAKRHREDRYLAFDEFPEQSFVTKFDSDTVARTVTYFVSNRPNLPFRNHHFVKNHDRSPDTHPEVETWLEQTQTDRNPTSLYGGTGGQDARGPLLTRIILQFEELDNGWRRADLGDGRIAVKSPNDNDISLLDPPPLDDTHGVIALDGTPCVDKWELLLGERLRHRQMFRDDEQKREFLRNVLEIKFIQTTQTDTKPYMGGNTNPGSDMALIEAIVDREGKLPSLISSKQAIEDYAERDVDDLLDKKRWFNDLKGMNDFSTDRLGIVIGCPQPGDNAIELWGALADQSIVRTKYPNGKPTEGVDLSFGPFGDRILRDARENEVLQAAMRFGRKESNGERGATVYVHTAAFPEWVQSEQLAPTIRSWEGNGGGENKVIRAIKDQEDWETGEWKTGEIAERVENLSEQQCRNLLKAPLRENDYIESRREGRGNAFVWSNVCLEEVGEYGVVEWQ